MPYQTIGEFNVTSGTDRIFLYVADVVPIFTPMMMFSIFIITLLGTYFIQRRLSGQANFASSFAVAGYFTLVIAFFLTLLEGMVNALTLSVCVIVAIIGTAWLLLSNE